MKSKGRPGLPFALPGMRSGLPKAVLGLTSGRCARRVPTLWGITRGSAYGPL